MGIARMELYKETEEEGKKRDMSMERSKVGFKKRRPDGLSPLSQNTLINIIRYHYSRHGNCIEIQLTKINWTWTIKKWNIEYKYNGPTFPPPPKVATPQNNGWITYLTQRKTKFAA